MDPSPPPPPNHPYSRLWNPKHAADVRLLRDQQEREKAEQERDRLEKLRGAEQAVDKHFEESLRPQRLAQHKQRSAGWNMAPTNTQHHQPQPRVVRDRYFPSHPHARFPLNPAESTPTSTSPYKLSYNYLPGLNLPLDVKNSVIVKNDKKSPAPTSHYRTSNNSLLIEAPNLHLQRNVYPSHSYSQPTHPSPPAPKVVSPAPAHIYSKPTPVKPPLSTSPYQQIPPHQPPLALSAKLPPPPPAHSTSAIPYMPPNHCDSSPQSQPLDLGYTPPPPAPAPSPPKRKLDHYDPAVSPAKKCCPPVDPTPPPIQQEPLSLYLTPGPHSEPVSEPAGLTTSPIPSSVMLTNENSNSSTGSLPSSTKTESSATNSSSGVHKLKKAWLQRHSGVETSTTPPPPVTPPPVTSTPPPSTHPNLTTGLAPGSSPSRPSSNLSTPPPSVNGHRGEDSSSSDETTEVMKRVPPKVKRKKKTKAGSSRSVTNSPVVDRKKQQHHSSSESEKECSEGGKKANGNNSPSKTNSSGKGSEGGGGNSSGGGGSSRKKGKKSSSKDSSATNSPAPPNDKDEDSDKPPGREPFQKPPVLQLKKTGESWLQDGPCFEVAPKLSKCRECRWTPNQRSRNNSNIFCRFYAFRRLRYTKNGMLAMAGFSNPYKDAGSEDIKLWLPDAENPPADIDVELGRFILLQLAGQFCDLLRQEDEALELNMAEENTVAWKRVVQGVREMCDVCETTLFNFHWACSKCGFVVCIDCYRDRKTGCTKVWGDGGRDRDEASWLLCNNRQPHEQDKLMLTQIIAGNCLQTLGDKMNEYKIANNINLYFKPDKTEVKDEKPESTLDWLADVALSKQNNSSQSTGNTSNSTDTSTPAGDEVVKAEPTAGTAGGGGFSKLRKLLIRKPANPSVDEKTETSDSITKTEPGIEQNATGPVAESSNSSSQSQKETDPSTETSTNTVQLKHFQRRKNYTWSDSNQLDIRFLTNLESQRLYPDVPHTWLCDGKLLRLTDPRCPGNYKIFQDMWRRGQPVLVSGVGAQLDQNLWHPDSFAADFGELRNDLINCVTGNTVPNQSMRKFWEGFEYCGKRLKDDKGQGMLLKLKDWPPGEDFAELLPTRFADLMSVLPLGEYTQRTGRLNLASRLPECFVKPDLGPKMYIAYGNALYPSKATTNLHLDISDAVNLMVYVGIPKDGDQSEYMREAYRAIDEGGSDILTRRRVRVQGELPGALWHIFAPRDADKIRDLLNKVAIEKGAILERNHDSIHDQSWYLDSELRDRLYHEYKVQAYTIVQCLGDAVFVPAGAPHQVRNLHSCIKVAEDFVSPENVSHCFHLTQEFRELSDTHSNHEDKLQVKNIIYHAVKDSLSVVESSEKKSSGSNGSTSTVVSAGTTS